MRLALQDSCHLRHAQQLPLSSRTSLGRIPGLEVVEPAEQDLCCGSAGIYNVVQAEAARDLGDRKAAHVLATGAQAYASANPGCLVQVSAALLRAQATAAGAPSDRARRRVDPQRRRGPAAQLGETLTGRSSSSRSTRASAGKSFHQAAATTMVAAPPSTTAGTAPMSAAATPDSNAPSSFDALMKTISTAVTRPRSSSGVTSGRIVERRTTLTVSNAAPSASASIDSHIVLREAEGDHAGAEPRDDHEEHRAGTTLDRVAGDHERAQQRADRGSGAEEAEPGRADLEDVLREDRKERDCAAEEHREQVERDRAQKHVRAPDQANAREYLVEADDALGGGRPAAAHRENAPEPDDREADRDDVDELGLDREEDAADRRPDDRGALERDRALGESADEDLLRHERRRQRTTGRRADRAPDPLDEREGEERPHVPAVRDGHGEEAPQHDGVRRRHRR